MIILSGNCSREYKDTFESTELLPNISMGDVQFAKIYYYDCMLVME